MRVNWKVRFKNPTWLAGFLGLLISFVYSLLESFDIVPVVPKATVLDFVKQVLMVLGLMGVLVDPTTAGLGDSQRALMYEEPWKDVG